MELITQEEFSDGATAVLVCVPVHNDRAGWKERAEVGCNRWDNRGGRWHTFGTPEIAGLAVGKPLARATRNSWVQKFEVVNRELDAHAHTLTHADTTRHAVSLAAVQL